MCTKGIKWLLMLICAGCSSAKSGIQVLDEQCREKYIRNKPQNLLVFMSYPYCRGCVEQISELLKEEAARHHLKPLYLLHYSGSKGETDCLNAQGMLARTRLGYPKAKPVYMLKDSLLISALPSGIHVQRGDKMWLRQDSLFNGMQLRRERVMEFIVKKRNDAPF